MKYLVCNLKNRLNKYDVELYRNKLENIKVNDIELIVLPSSIFYHYFQEDNYKLGAQDISSIIDEVVTGEITGEQLKTSGIEYVLVGHSERRIYKHEINIDFINKMNAADEKDIKKIYCIGETLKQKEDGDTFQVLEQQISEVLNNIDLKNLIIAYEPVWAIGTGLVPNANEIKEIILFIKDLIEELYEIDIDVIYGGSVNKDNIQELIQIKNLDGFIIGNASLDVEIVQNIIENMEK